VLIKRRNKIAGIYLTAVNPVVNPQLDAGGRLTVENAAVAAGVAKAPSTYRAAWLLFDNATGETKPIADTQSATTTIAAPPGLPSAAGSMIAIDIAADNGDHPAWKQPVRTYFRRTATGWTLVGLDRVPERVPTGKTVAPPAR
jgi:hypothetical protein